MPNKDKVTVRHAFLTEGQISSFVIEKEDHSVIEVLVDGVGGGSGLEEPLVLTQPATFQGFISEGVESTNLFEGSVVIDGTLTVDGVDIAGGGGDFLPLSGGSITGPLNIFSTDTTTPTIAMRHPFVSGYPQIQGRVGSGPQFNLGRARLIFSLYNPNATVQVRPIVGFGAEGYYHDGEVGANGLLEYPSINFYDYSTNVTSPGILCTLSSAVNISKSPFKVGGYPPMEVSAMMSVNSTTLGFLPPRMTTTQRNAIVTPAEGLQVYDLTLHKVCVFTGSVWETVTSS